MKQNIIIKLLERDDLFCIYIKCAKNVNTHTQQKIYITSNKEKVTSKEQIITSDKQKVTNSGQIVTSNEQQTETNENNNEKLTRKRQN